MMASVADNVMVGQLGSEQLAAAAFANTIYALFILFGIGVAIGITPLVGKAHGENNQNQKASLFKHGFYSNLLVGAGIMIIMVGLIPLMPFMGQPNVVIINAIPYYITLVATIPFTMVFFHFKQSGEGIYITKPTMYITIIGNLINIFLNFIFIYGMWGVPAYGVLGAGIATLISRILMTFMLVFYFNRTHFKVYFLAFGDHIFSWKKIRFILKNSLPIGFQYIIEISAFVIGTVMVGWLGTVPLAAHQIAINLVSITYLVASGIAGATTIRVSNLRGLKNYEDLFVAARSGTKLVIGFMVFASVVFLLGNRFFPSLYIDEIPVIDLASKLLIVGVIFQLFDGIQVIGLGILRGLNDLKRPTYIAAIAYWLIGLPFSYYFGIYLDIGAVGIWYGYLAGLSTASILLFVRVNQVKKRLL